MRKRLSAHYFYIIFIFLLNNLIVFALTPEFVAAQLPKLEKNKNVREGGQFNEDAVELSGADEGEYIRLTESGHELVILKGNIRMKSGKITVHARNVVYNRRTGDITFSDDVRFEDGGNIFYADKCIYNVKDKTGVLYGVRSERQPLFFSSEKIRIIDKKKYIGEGIYFSTCNLKRPHYHFRVDKVWIHSDKRLIAYDAIYVVGDMPLFYFPAIAHTDEGIGIITQFGQSIRRGNFIQNTLRYTAEDRSRWKYKLDIYEKLGYYGGIEYAHQTPSYSLEFYLAGARFKSVDEDLNNTSQLPEENWYKSILRWDADFFKRRKGNSHINLQFEWMNNWDFERNFDNRNEPRTTIEMIRFIPRNIFEVKRYLDWSLTLSDRGDRHNVSLSMKRQWMWNDTLNPDDVDDYTMRGLYKPLYDQIPEFSASYNGTIPLFSYASEDKGKNEQFLNWNLYLGGNSYKQYLLGEHFRTTYTYNGFLSINTVFPLLNVLSYMPGLKVGFNAQRIEDPNELSRESSEEAAEKNSFQYIDSTQTLKIGFTQYYLQATHVYRRSYLEERVVQPFVHEKLNYFEGGLFLFPLDGITMTVTTSYDARREFPFEDERWRDVVVKNNVFFDFYNFFKGSSLLQKRKGLFYSGIAIANDYTYIVKDKTSGYNTLDVSFTTGNFYLLGIRRVNNIELGYNWFHDFRFRFRDTMGIRWNFSAELSRLWRINIGGTSQADRSYLLYDKRETTPFDEFERSFYFYDKKKSDNAVFTLRNFYIDILHDLHCWEVGLSYHLERSIERVGENNRDRLIYYEQRIFITLRMKSFTEVGVTGAQIYGTGEEVQH